MSSIFRDFRLVSCRQGSRQDPLHLLLVDNGEMISTQPPRPDEYGKDGLDELLPQKKRACR